MNFDAHSDDLTVENVILVLEDLGIEPCEFTEVIGHDIFSDVLEGNVVDKNSSDSECEEWGTHANLVGGLNSSKIAQVGIELSHQCFRITCECCNEGVCVLDTPTHKLASDESLHISQNWSATSMSTQTADCPSYELAILEEDATSVESSDDSIP